MRWAPEFTKGARMQAPSVSVILPTYNRALYIAEAIGSLLAQTRPPLEIVVIDDGSTDGTEAEVASFGDAVTYVKQDNAGKLTAISAGLDRIRGDLVWIMDDDDIAPPDALRNLAAPFAADPSVVMTYGRMTKFSGTGATLQESLLHYPEDDRPFFIRLMEECFITGHPCVLCRREALEAVRPFDTKIFASVDYYLHLEVARQGRVAAVDSIVLRQRQHDGLRGPLSNRYGEAERVAKWIAHDAYIIGGLLDRLPLDAFLAPPPWRNGPLAPRDRRHALLQRAVIAGRNKVWPRALEDLAAAMAIQRDDPLDRAALGVLSGLLGSRYGIDEVTASPDILDGLRDAVADRIDRAAVLAALSRPLLQHIKSGRSIGRAARVWVRLMDIPATRLALAASLSRNFDRFARRLRQQ